MFSEKQFSNRFRFRDETAPVAISEDKLRLNKWFQKCIATLTSSEAEQPDVNFCCWGACSNSILEPQPRVHDSQLNSTLFNTTLR